MKKNSCDRWWGKSHDFGNWEITEEGDLRRGSIYDYTYRMKVGRYIIQQRKCLNCGFSELNTQKINPILEGE